MKASVDGRVVAESEDIVACRGYEYFPRAAVRTDWLEKAEKTERDLECPHGVQFYDVVVDGKRHKRAGAAARDGAGGGSLRLLGRRRGEIAAGGRRRRDGAREFQYLPASPYAAAAFLRLASSRASTRATVASITGWRRPFCAAMS
jgi:hypothetical protein